MRLGVLERGHRLPQRVALAVMRLVGRTEPDSVAKLALYRPELFGRAFLRLLETVMRGPSEWSEGERELMAAFVSRLNGCRFCTGIHEGTAGLLLGSDALARLDGWRAEPESRLAAAFGLLEKLILAPEMVGPADVQRARAAGVSDAAIADALHVCYLFDAINRVANALGFDWRTDADRMKLASGLNRMRYHVPGVLLR